MIYSISFIYSGWQYNSDTRVEAASIKEATTLAMKVYEEDRGIRKLIKKGLIEKPLKVRLARGNLYELFVPFDER